MTFTGIIQKKCSEVENSKEKRKLKIFGEKPIRTMKKRTPKTSKDKTATTILMEKMRSTLKEEPENLEEKEKKKEKEIQKKN